MELVIFIEKPFVNVSIIMVHPSQGSYGSFSFFISTLKTIVFSFFCSLPIKGIIFKTSFIIHLIRLIVSDSTISTIIPKLSLIKRPIVKDVDPFSFGFAILEVSNVNTSIRFIHFSKAIRFIVHLRYRKSTKLSCPLYTSLSYFRVLTFTYECA